MASTSVLRTQKTTSAQDNNGQPWSDLECSTEVMSAAISGITLGASDAAANAGATATKAIFVQGGTGGLALATKVAGGDNVVEGNTTGAAVITDANGTIQQYLRGLVKLAITAGGWLTTLSAGSAIVGKVGIDQTTAGSTNATQPKQYTGVPSSFAIQTADQTVFTLAAGEIGFIQNLSADAPLAVKKGASASTTSLNFILAKSGSASDGTGGAIKIDDWVGVVSVAKMTGTASYLAWKQAP